MRPLLFRAWDKHAKKMIFTGFSIIGEVTVLSGLELYIHEHPIEGISSLDRLLDLIIMQYTGKKDSTGKLIYEGDKNQDGGVVVWNEESASFCWEYKDIELMDFEAEEDWCIVSGNIYED